MQTPDPGLRPDPDPGPSPGPGPTLDAALDRVYRRAGELRARRRAVAGAALAGALLVGALPVLALGAGDGDGARPQRVAAADGERTWRPPSPTWVPPRQETPPSTDTTAVPPPPAVEPPPTTTGPVSQTTATPRTTMPDGPCRNSTDPACGPFHWDPDPGPNEPLSIEVRYTPANPRAGDEVVFTITARDPDARIHRECNHFEDPGEGEPEQCYVTPGCVAQYGAWTPPPRERDEWVMTFRHTYRSSGTYTAKFMRMSGGMCNDPYASRADTSVTVTVG